MNTAMVVLAVYITGFATYPLVESVLAGRPQVDQDSPEFALELLVMLLKSLVWPVMVLGWAFACYVSCFCRIGAVLRRVFDRHWPRSRAGISSDHGA